VSPSRPAASAASWPRWSRTTTAWPLCCTTAARARHIRRGPGT
jgi:hypothetical protein